MPTTLDTSTVFSGYIRNTSVSINSISKVEVPIYINNKLRTFEKYQPIVFEGKQLSTTISMLSSSNSHRNATIAEPIASFTFSGSINKAESTVLITDDLNISVVDSQDYVIVLQEVQVNLPFWS